MAADRPPPIGAELGRYRLVRRIGEGARGIVYQADDPAFDRSVAVKVLRPVIAGDPELAKAFQDEAESTAQVQHENVISILDRGESGGYLYYVMEYVDGPNLEERLREVERLPWLQAVQITIQIAMALREAHTLGFLHRDVKPGNILIFSDGRVRLTDFGIVKDISSLKGFLVPGKPVGTAVYASPEQCLGKRLMPATDVYSLGATLYHLVTGRYPFPGKTNQESMTGHVKGRLVPPIDLCAELPRPLNNAIVKMMARNPRHRYESMDRVIADLEMIAAGKKPLGPAAPARSTGPVRIEARRTDLRASERAVVRRGRTSGRVWIVVGLLVTAAVVAIVLLIA